MLIYETSPTYKTPSGHFADAIMSDGPQLLSSRFYSWDKTCTKFKYNEKGDASSMMVYKMLWIGKIKEEIVSSQMNRKVNVINILHRTLVGS